MYFKNSCVNFSPSFVIITEIGNYTTKAGIIVNFTRLLRKSLGVAPCFSI